jgi:two-component sensor histidine kinase
VGWDIAGSGADRRIRLEWKESGGPKVKPPARRGFGRRLIEEALSYELGGRAELNFDPAGFSCVIEVSAADGLANDYPSPPSDTG